jgi:hypothetical protein
MGPLKSPPRVAAEPGSNAESRSTPRLGMGDVRPRWSLWLLSIAHAVNHAQAVVLPLIYLKITDDFPRIHRSPGVIHHPGQANRCPSDRE